MYSKSNGIYKGINIPEELQAKVIGIHDIVNKGEEVHECTNAADIVAIIDFKFDSLAELNSVREQLPDLVTVNLG